MEKLKNIYAKGMARLTVSVLATEWTSREKKVLAGLAGGSVLMARVSGAAAAKGDLEKAVNDVVKDAYGIIFGVSTGIAVVFIAWHLVCIMTTGDPQTTRMHVQTIKKVAIAWAVLNCLGAIYATVSHIVKGNEYKF